MALRWDAHVVVGVHVNIGKVLVVSGEDCMTKGGAGGGLPKISASPGVSCRDLISLIMVVSSATSDDKAYTVGSDVPLGGGGGGGGVVTPTGSMRTMLEVLAVMSNGRKRTSASTN